MKVVARLVRRDADNDRLVLGVMITGHTDLLARGRVYDIVERDDGELVVREAGESPMTPLDWGFEISELLERWGKRLWAIR